MPELRYPAPKTEPEVEVRYITLHESVAQSWLKDIALFGCIGALAVTNHQWAEGSWVVDALIVFVCLTFSARWFKHVRSKHPIFTREELRQWAMKQDNN